MWGIEPDECTKWYIHKHRLLYFRVSRPSPSPLGLLPPVIQVLTLTSKFYFWYPLPPPLRSLHLWMVPEGNFHFLHTWQSCSLVCFSSISILSAESSKAELRLSLSAISWWTFFSRSFFRLVTRSISSRRISRWVTWSWTVILLSVTWSRSWLMRLANSCSLEAEAWKQKVFVFKHFLIYTVYFSK